MSSSSSSSPPSCIVSLPASLMPPSPLSASALSPSASSAATAFSPSPSASSAASSGAAGASFTSSSLSALADFADVNRSVVADGAREAALLAALAASQSALASALSERDAAHAAIREDVTSNLAALEDLMRVYPTPKLLLCESGGDNLAANFSSELADYTIYVIDVAGGDKVPRKGGPGVTQSDLLVINKIDLAEAVGADLKVMARDAAKMRGE